MNHKFFLVFFLFFNSIIFGQELTWHTNAKVAVELSKNEKKPLLMFFTGSDWCGWCIRLQKEVFTQPEFKKWANENVVLLELDFPRRSAQDENLKIQNSQILQAFGVRGYPTIWIVNSSINNEKVDFNPLGSVGYVAGGPAKWIEVANSILIKNK